MRKVYLQLVEDTDLRAYKETGRDGSNYWKLRNRNNEMCVVNRAHLCRSILDGLETKKDLPPSQ